MMASPALKPSVKPGVRFESTSRRGWCPSAHRPMETGDGWLARVRPMAGVLDADQAASLARWASTAGNGALDLTRRGNLQIRGLTSAAAHDLAGALVDMGLAAPSADAEARRVVLGVAATDNDPAAIAPVSGLAAGLDAGLRALPETCALPEKALIVVNGGGRFALADHPGDLRLDAVATASGPHWRLSINGPQSGGRSIATFPDDQSAADGALTVLRRALGAMAPSSGRRGLAAALSTTADAMAPYAEPPAPDPSTDPWPPIGPLPTIGVGIGFAFGALDADMLSALAILSRDAGDGSLCLLPTHAIVVPGDPDALWSHPALKTLAAGGAIINPTDPRLGLFACRGRQGCPKGTTDTRRDALALAGPLADYLSAGGRVHVSGCDKACARPTKAAGITLTAADGVYRSITGPDIHHLNTHPLPNNIDTNGA